jgi:addiction module HigA family antidote
MNTINEQSMKSIAERKRCPSHPGKILKEFYLDELGLSITEFAADIGVSRKAVSAIVNGRKSVTAEMALRVARATVTSPRLWLNLQSNFDLWQVAHTKEGLLDRIRPIAAAL